MRPGSAWEVAAAWAAAAAGGAAAAVVAAAATAAASSPTQSLPSDSNGAPSTEGAPIRFGRSVARRSVSRAAAGRLPRAKERRHRARRAIHLPEAGKARFLHHPHARLVERPGVHRED